MSSLEERDVGVAAAPGSSSAGLGVGAVGAAVEAVAGVAAMQDEVGIRREGPESDTDEPPKKRVKVPEGESGKLEERLYSVLCCTVCLDLPKASVYQVNMVSITNLPLITLNLLSNNSNSAGPYISIPPMCPNCWPSEPTCWICCPAPFIVGSTRSNKGPNCLPYIEPQGWGTPWTSSQLFLAKFYTVNYQLTLSQSPILQRHTRTLTLNLNHLAFPSHPPCQCS